jgi:hypothetical protein
MFGVLVVVSAATVLPLRACPTYRVLVLYSNEGEDLAATAASATTSSATTSSAATSAPATCRATSRPTRVATLEGPAPRFADSRHNISLS